MSCAPFDVQPIIARLKAQVASLQLVAGAADYATVQRIGDFRVPSAYVLLATERAEPYSPGNAMPGVQVRVQQRASVNFGVVHVVRNYRDQDGAQSQDSLLAVVGAVRQALLGWVPDVPGGRPCQLLQGDLGSYDRATSLWMDVYQTQHFIGVNPS